MSILKTPNGLTIAELKEYLKSCRDVNSYTEEPFEVWLGNRQGTSNYCAEVCPLNKREEGHDIILEVSDDREATLHELIRVITEAARKIMFIDGCEIVIDVDEQGSSGSLSLQVAWELNDLDNPAKK